MTHLINKNMNYLCGAIIFIVVLLNGCAIQESASVRGNSTPVVVEADIQDKFDRASDLLREQKYEQAIELLNKILETEKRLPAPYINLALAYRQKGDNNLAEENLLKALSIDKTQPVASNELGIIYRKQGRFTEARQVYVNALTDYPDYLPVIKNLGILCDLYLRDLECALEQFENYQHKAPEDETIKIWIADVKSRM